MFDGGRSGGVSPASSSSLSPDLPSMQYFPTKPMSTSSTNRTATSKFQFPGLSGALGLVANDSLEQSTMDSELRRLFFTPAQTEPQPPPQETSSFGIYPGMIRQPPPMSGYLPPPNRQPGPTATTRLPVSMIETPQHSIWDEFNRNGRESDLDELDRLLRGLDVREGCMGSVMRLPDNEANSDVLTKARLLEILRDRERLRTRRQKPKAPMKPKVCVFCRNNGEAESTYTSHRLKDQDGKITCPVLYIYTCPLCGADGPNAHTIKYCPCNPGDTLSVGRALKTQRTSTGRKYPHWDKM